MREHIALFTTENQSQTGNTWYASLLLPSPLKYPTATFGPPMTISPRGIGLSLMKYPPSGQFIS